MGKLRRDIDRYMSYDSDLSSDEDVKVEDMEDRAKEKEKVWVFSVINLQ
jgi:hypothetical protein